jgi:hypothetical protein
MWVQSVLRDLGIPSPAKLWCDNMGARYLASNPIFHGRMKHVETWVRDTLLRTLYSMDE